LPASQHDRVQATHAVQAGCIGWPIPMTNPPHAVGITGTPPILLVNSLYEPTPSASHAWVLLELDGAVAAVQLADDGAVGDVEGGEQAGDAVPQVVVGASLALVTDGRESGSA
jgi:hypothetical protein